MVRRGDVWLCTLDPTVGSEIRKTRSCLVVSPDGMNNGLRTVLTMPLTSGGRPSRFRVSVTFRGKPGLILRDQMRALDKMRLTKRLGQVETATLQAVLEVLGQMFAE